MYNDQDHPEMVIVWATLFGIIDLIVLGFILYSCRG
jgi:hypothetical protein